MFNYDYDFVHKELKYPQERIEGFDFNCVCCAFDGTYFYFGSKFKKDLINKKVSVRVITKPLSSLNRLISYALKDWDIKETYKYILKVMMDKNENICLLGDYYGSKQK